MRVALFDDDLLTRAGARQVLGRGVLAGVTGIDRFETHSLASGLAWSGPQLAMFDWLVVEIVDQRRVRSELATDIYAGIEVIETVRSVDADVKVIATIPDRTNPLLMERLVGCGTDFVVERSAVRCPADLARAVLRPSAEHRPARFPEWVLIEEGLGLDADPNRAVARYKLSPLYGRIEAGRTQSATGPRRAAVHLRDEVIATGFVGRGRRPRWNEVRDYLLKLCGRLPVTARAHDLGHLVG